jgi:hypothetical protein
MLNRGIEQGIFKSLIETFSRECEQMPDSGDPDTMNAATSPMS